MFYPHSYFINRFTSFSKKEGKFLSKNPMKFAGHTCLAGCQQQLTFSKTLLSTGSYIILSTSNIHHALSAQTLFSSLRVANLKLSKSLLLHNYIKAFSSVTFFDKLAPILCYKPSLLIEFTSCSDLYGFLLNWSDSECKTFSIFIAEKNRVTLSTTSSFSEYRGQLLVLSKKIKELFAVPLFCFINNTFNPMLYVLLTIKLNLIVIYSSLTSHCYANNKSIIK